MLHVQAGSRRQFLQGVSKAGARARLLRTLDFFFKNRKVKETIVGAVWVSFKKRTHAFEGLVYGGAWRHACQGLVSKSWEVGRAL